MSQVIAAVYVINRAVNVIRVMTGLSADPVDGIFVTCSLANQAVVTLMWDLIQHSCLLPYKTIRIIRSIYMKWIFISKFADVACERNCLQETMNIVHWSTIF